MKTKGNVFRMTAFLIITLLFGGMSAHAEKRAWAEYDSAEGSLTFYYTDKDALGDNEFDTNNGQNLPGWYDVRKSIKRVVIDKTFAQARPTSCHAWFRGIKASNIEGLKYLNTSMVEDMSYMFCECEALTSLDVSNFNTSKVTNMHDMFAFCSALNTLNLAVFNTSNVTNMSGMFASCSALSSLNISNFETSNVTTMNGMFFGCSALTSLNLSNFDTSKVKDMYEMFLNCSSFTSLDLSSFITPKVTNMYGMFQGCRALTSLNISNFDTSKVQNMSFMFSGLSSITTLKVSSFDTSASTDVSYMFSDCPNLAEIYATSAFAIPDNCKSDGMFSGSTKLCGDIAYKEGKTDKTYATIKNGYLSDIQYLRPWVQYSSKTLTFKYSFKRSINGTDEFELNEGENTPKWVNMQKAEEITDVVFKESFAQVRPTSCFKWFSGFTGLKTIEGMENLNTSEVTTMNGMFEMCKNLESLDLSKFDTHNVTNMKSMFMACQSLKSIDLSKFDTHNVTDMNSMFMQCTGLTSLDVSKFDTKNVTDMYIMFSNCNKLTTLDVSNFNTQNVSNMGSMFADCSSLTSLDVSNFDTQAATTMEHMFENCSGLKTIYLGEAFKLDADIKGICSDCPATIYCSPMLYNSCAEKLSNTVKPYVNINANAEYGTLCVPIGSSLAEGSFTGFDKLYTVKGADKDKSTIVMEESTTIEPGVAYVYHRNLPEGASKSVITFDADDASTAVTAPKNENRLLKGTFERITALGGSYILQTDGNFHPVSADNTTLGVGAYRAYLDLSSLPGFDNTGDVEANAFRMVFDNKQPTAIDGVIEKADRQPKAYFDLTGRKVSTPKHGGIYIQNGKKLIYNN